MAENVLKLSFKVRVSDYREEQFSHSGNVVLSTGAKVAASGEIETSYSGSQLTLCRHFPVPLSGDEFIKDSYHPIVEYPFGSAMNLVYQLYSCDGRKITTPVFKSAYIAIGELSHPASINADGTISYLFDKSDYKVLVKGQIYDTVLYVIDSKGNNSIVSKQLLRLI